MKKYFILLLALIIGTSAYAQVPDKISYQMIVRDAANQVMKDSAVSIEIAILSENPGATPTYIEWHTDTTNANGLLGLVIGEGAVQSGAMNTIDWSSGRVFLRTRLDLSASSTFTGAGTTTQMLSSPYALYTSLSDSAQVATHADSVDMRASDTGDTLFIGSGGQFVIIPGLSEANTIPPYPYTHCLPNGDTTVVQDVTSGTGKVWMDRNLGASEKANAKTSSKAYGDLFQYGRFAEGHQCRDSDTYGALASTAEPDSNSGWAGKFIIDADNNWQATDIDTMWSTPGGPNNPCPSGYRVPTASEWKAEFDSWSSQDANGAIGSPLKFPLGGYRDGESGSITSAGTFGTYWASNAPLLGNNGKAFYYGFDDTGGTGQYQNMSYGSSVRCIKITD